MYLNQEQWKHTSASKRKDRTHAEDENGGRSEKRRRKGEKKRKREKKSRSETEEAGDMDDQEEMEDEYVNRNYKHTDNAMNDDGDEFEENPQDLLAAAGLEDSDAEADTVENPSATNRKRRAWSESEDDEPIMRQPESSPMRENSAEMQVSDGD